MLLLSKNNDMRALIWFRAFEPVQRALGKVHGSLRFKCLDIYIACATCLVLGVQEQAWLIPSSLVATTALVANQAAAGAVGGISAGSVLLAFANLLATPARIEVPAAQTRELSSYDTPDSEPEQRSYLSYASRENLCFYFGTYHRPYYRDDSGFPPLAPQGKGLAKQPAGPPRYSSARPLSQCLTTYKI